MVEAMPLVRALRMSWWAYPAVNTLHIVGSALLFGAIVPVDLRLAGWRRSTADLATTSRLLLPVAVTGFIIAAIAGLLLFATDARAYAASALFRAKLVLICLALLNVALLARVDWRAAALPGRRLSVHGLASLLLWLGVIVLGRAIGYA
jgi:hypothetical protein